jgi:hypothetical protein
LGGGVHDVARPVDVLKTEGVAGFVGGGIDDSDDAADIRRLRGSEVVGDISGDAVAAVDDRAPGLGERDARPTVLFNRNDDVARTAQRADAIKGKHE